MIKLRLIIKLYYYINLKVIYLYALPKITYNDTKNCKSIKSKNYKIIYSSC